MTDWSKNFWTIMYDVADNIPSSVSTQVSQQYTIFFTNLQYLLPCEKCKRHYANYLTDNPLEINRIKMLNWLNLLKDNIKRTQIYEQFEKITITPKQQSSIINRSQQPQKSQQSKNTPRPKLFVEMKTNTDEHKQSNSNSRSFGIKPRSKGYAYSRPPCNNCDTHTLL
jgi:hypothetical protein